MNRSPKYSIIVPVYNRPQEVDELLSTLTRQEFKDFEVLIVEDGSSVKCDNAVETYRESLDIHYYFKSNSGPGPSRNFGFEKARGEFFIVFDSDCLLPSHYLKSVEDYLQQFQLDAWGGSDRGHEDFSKMQRAMAYTMSSFLTTGGIRGGNKKLGWFQPRSFNMGFSRKVYEATGGFKLDRYAEDIELSIRIKKKGFNVGYIPEAYVFHKRRATLGQFYNQVFNFGRGRVIVGTIHPEEVKLTHWLPSLFMVGFVMALISPWFLYPLGMIPLGLYVTYFLILAIHSYITTKSALVALYSIPSAFAQFFGYGLGFIKERLKG